MTIYKLKLWVDGVEEGSSAFKDLYLDVDLIQAFYIPDNESEGETVDEESITLFINGGALSVKSEDHIQEFLWNKFGKNAVKK